MQAFSQEAMERPRRTIQAAEVLREQAPTIWHATTVAGRDEMVVAVVQKDLTFGGAHTIPRERLAEQVPLVEGDGGWSMLFSSHSTVMEIEKRCLEFSQLAARRWQLMQRRAYRQDDSL